MEDLRRPTPRALDLPLDEIAELCRSYDLLEFSVFGSGLLRDDFDADRDIDFLVLFRPDAKIGFLDFRRCRGSWQACLDGRSTWSPSGGSNRSSRTRC